MTDNMNYRVVVVREVNPETTVLAMQGLQGYSFTYENAQNLAEEIMDLDGGLDARVEIDCPVHGWEKSLIGECYECHREAPVAIEIDEYLEKATDDPCRLCDAMDCRERCPSRVKYEARMAHLANLDANPRFADPFARPDWNGDPNEY